MPTINIYTDGAARGNPGPGGYGVVMQYGKHKKEFSKGYRHTTNNRMELLAVIVALQAIKNKDLPIHIYSDSKYVVDAIKNKWYKKWEATQFKKKKNSDLWMRFSRLADGLQIQTTWVKGHAGHPFNERCDVLATQAADGNNLLIDEQFEALKNDGLF